MIVNPSSASASKGDSWKDFLKILTDGGLEVEPLLTERPAHAIELAQKAAEGGARQFIAVGGDGTIHEVMTGLLRYSEQSKTDMGEFTLGVIPYGTGNDWIKTSGVPADLTKAAGCIIAGKTAKEDVVKMTFSNGIFCMANIGGVGIDADICYNTNSLKTKGYKGDILYKMVAPYSILSKQRYPAEITCDGEVVFKGKLLTAVIGNGIYRGGGIKQNQEGGNWNDGLLEVSIMGDVNRFKGLSNMMHVFSGDFAVLPGIITKRFRKMEIKPLGKPHRVEADGEIPGTLPLTVEYIGQQINIIVP